MKTIQITKPYFHGAISLETIGDGIKPWRIPHDRFDLYPPNGINGTGEKPAGVRLIFESDTTALQLEFEPAEYDLQFDCVISGEIVEAINVAAGGSIAKFSDLPQGHKVIEIYLSQNNSVIVKQLHIHDEASITPHSSKKPKWITYGSSISQCNAAASPAETWPAIVARRKSWDLTCLGYSGNCHIEPMIARMIRDREADFISLCLGINVNGGNSLSPRTFRAAVIGMISIIREKHQDIPIALMSPIYSFNRETADNLVGLSLIKMREEIYEAVEALKQYGDRNLFYIDGLEVFGEEYKAYLPDKLHPDAEGYKAMAEQVLKQFDLNSIDQKLVD